MTRCPSTFENGARIGAAALALVLWLCGGTPVSAAENPGRVEGTVVAADTGAPLKGVQVTLEGWLLPDGRRIQPVPTDDRGRFVFDRISAHKWLVCARAPDDSPYVSAVTWSFSHRGDAIEIEVKPTSITRVTVRLRKGGEILVRTVRRDGTTPWPGFQATSSTPTLSRLIPPGGTVENRSQPIGGGEYLLRGVPPDTPLKLEADPKGYVYVRLSPVAVAVGERKPVDVMIDLDDPTGIEGTAPPDRILTVVREADREIVASHMVGPDGRFSIVGLPPGRYVVWSRQQEYSIEVRSDAKTRLDIPVPAGPAAPPKTVGSGPDARAPTQARLDPKVDYCPALEPTLAKRDAAIKAFNDAYTEAVDKLLSCLPESCLRRLRPRLFEGAGGEAFKFTIKCFNPPCGAYHAVNIQVGWDAFIQPSSTSKCGCLPSVIFHEITHDAGYDECPAYRCAKKCFPCAADLEGAVVRTMMDDIPLKCPDDTPCCSECK